MPTTTTRASAKPEKEPELIDNRGAAHIINRFKDYNSIAFIGKVSGECRRYNGMSRTRYYTDGFIPIKTRDEMKLKRVAIYRVGSVFSAYVGIGKHSLLNRSVSRRTDPGFVMMMCLASRVSSEKQIAMLAEDDEATILKSAFRSLDSIGHRTVVDKIFCIDTFPSENGYANVMNFVSKKLDWGIFGIEDGKRIGKLKDALLKQSPYAAIVSNILLGERRLLERGLPLFRDGADRTFVFGKFAEAVIAEHGRQ